MERGEAEGRSLIDAMEQGELEGMQTFDGVIERLVRDGAVTREDALSYATNAGNMQLRLSDMGGVGAAPPQAPAPKKQDGSGSMLDMIE
ncbi:MAG TPA: hypothetical protein VE360_03250, partial [Pyrinomonadaceae bacterium]|nr:hypothetical protein [Pyrinomonadaceae bacterium]